MSQACAIEPGSTRSTRGFTLLEVVVVVAVFSLAAAFIIPIGDKYVRQQMDHATRQEMLALREAVFRYYADVQAFPAALTSLNSKPTGVTSWMGPYLTADFGTQTTTEDDYRYDAWRHAYQIINSGTYQRTLRSSGENGVDDSGGGDDIDLCMNVAPILRDITVKELEIINAAVRAFNTANLPGTALSATYTTLLGQLQAAGYLPNNAATTTQLGSDGWGQAYLTVGATPVIEVTSAASP
ncbi:MAG: type II secretion system protein GspG [Planctomycetota bacterium]